MVSLCCPVACNLSPIAPRHRLRIRLYGKCWPLPPMPPTIRVALINPTAGSKLISLPNNTTSSTDTICSATYLLTQVPSSTYLPYLCSDGVENKALEGQQTTHEDLGTLAWPLLQPPDAKEGDMVVLYCILIEPRHIAQGDVQPVADDAALARQADRLILGMSRVVNGCQLIRIFRHHLPHWHTLARPGVNRDICTCIAGPSSIFHSPIWHLLSIITGPEHPLTDLLDSCQPHQPRLHALTL